ALDEPDEFDQEWAAEDRELALTERAITSARSLLFGDEEQSGETSVPVESTALLDPQPAVPVAASDLPPSQLLATTPGTSGGSSSPVIDKQPDEAREHLCCQAAASPHHKSVCS